MKYLYAILFLTFLVSAQRSVAQKAKKPQVLVYGSDILAYTAAIQSVQSGVPTLWVADVDTLVPEFTRHAVQINDVSGLDGGLWLDMLMDMALAKNRNDSLARVVKLDMKPRLFLNAMERNLTKHKDLQLVRKQQVRELKYDGKGWAVVLNNKQKYHLRCVIDASDDQKLSAMRGLESAVIGDLPTPDALSQAPLETMRTLVASGWVDSTICGVTLARVLQAEQSGFFSLASVHPFLRAVPEDVALRASIGQAMGATAAYLAFFKTSAAKIDVRKLQTELMTYGMRIIPYQDIAVDDPHFYALQRFGLAAVLMPASTNGQFLLAGEESVSFRSIQPIFHRLFSRSQLWFADHNGDFLTWDDFLSLIRFVGLKGEEVDRQIEKDWSTKLKFKGHFDRNRYVTRYQFAVVLDLYASPYVKAVNQEGMFVN